MSIWDLDKLILFVGFVIPGFISIKTYELYFPTQDTDTSKKIIDAIAFSCINYGLLFWAIYLVETNKLIDSYTLLYFTFYIFVLFIAPIIWTIIWKRIRENKRFQKNIPHPTLKPWDCVFQKRKSYWVVVTLKNGLKVGGLYSNNSYTSSYPGEEQIYLEEQWKLNKAQGFDRKINQTNGILITKDISTIEFYEC